MEVFWRIGVPAAVGASALGLVGIVAYQYAELGTDDPSLMGGVAVLGSAVLLMLLIDLVQFGLIRLVGRPPLASELASFRAIKASALGSSSVVFILISFSMGSSWALFAALLSFGGTVEMTHEALAALHGHPRS